MTKKSKDNPQEPPRLLSSWPEILNCLLEFPKRKIMSVGYEDIGQELEVKEWVFRGINGCYELEPAIERAAEGKTLDWTSLEALALSEFKARARVHLAPSLIPDENLTFIWLALMQHYAIPTRLLDFTYSPFVALYFAIRNGHEHAQKNGITHVRLWAVNAVEVGKRFRGVARASARADHQQHEKGKSKLRAMSLDPATYAREREIMFDETGLHETQSLITELLSPISNLRMSALEQSGCVCAAPPPAFNPRLASQQGVFLFNCADDLKFWDSLNKMMGPWNNIEWYKKFDIPVSLIPLIEDHLFQMNIHEQSLFPDMEGLAGLIRQKIRLHWGPI